MHGHETLVFLLSLAALLGGARLLGEGARALGLPLVAGEIATGIVLGQTGLRRVLPGTYAWLFPSGPAADMLSGYTTLSVVLLLVVAGLEVDLGIVRRRGRTALLVAALGLAAPLAGGFILGELVPNDVLGAHGERTLFAMFMGVALSISALPVIAKTLLDLGLFKTDVGLLVMTVAMLDDLVGWLCFSVLLGPMRGGAIDLGSVVKTLLFAAAFAILCLVPGRRLVDRAFALLEAESELAPGRALALVAVLAMLAAAATQAIGLHAVLGGFVLGITVGDSPRLRERTRHTIHQFVTNVFAPVFFASVALRVDFVASFDFGLCVAVFTVATAAKLVGCAGGARLTGLGWREALAVGFGLNARGAMEILLALLAREAKLIDDRVFVALIVMALATSLLAGPAMKRLLYPARKAGGAAAATDVDDAAALVREGAFLSELTSSTSARAIEELGRALRTTLGDLVEPALIATLEREMVAPTGLGNEVAIPHAAVEGLKRPVVALGLSAKGIDFDAPDGRPARIVFLLLLPPKAYENEVRVLAALVRSVYDDRARDELYEAKSVEDAVRCLDENGRRIGGNERGPRLAGLAEM